MTPHAFGQMVQTGACPTCGGDGQGPRARPASAATASGASCASGPGTSRSRPGSRPASGSGSAAPATRASPAAPAGDLYVEVRVAEDERFERRGAATSSRSSRSRSPRRCSAARSSVADARRRARGRGCPPGAQPGHTVRARRARPAVAARRLARRPARGRRRRGPEQAQPRAAASSARQLHESLVDDGRRVIRLAVRCRAELAERVLAELLELAPGRGRGGARRGLGRVRDLRRRRASCRRCRRLEAAAGGRPGRDQLDRDPRRLGRPLARLPPAGLDRGRADRRPAVVGAGHARRRSCADPGIPGAQRGGRALTSSSIPARRSAPAPTRPPRSAWSCCSSSPTPGRPRARSSTSAPAPGCWRSPPRSSAGRPVVGCDSEPAALEAAPSERRRQRGRARARAGQPARRAGAVGADRGRQPDRAAARCRVAAAARRAAAGAGLLGAARRPRSSGCGRRSPRPGSRSVAAPRPRRLGRAARPPAPIPPARPG